MLPSNVASIAPFAIRFAAVAVAVSVVAPLSSATVELGPPPDAVLSREKLSPIDDFLNDEIASGKIPGAIVLIQHHGQPVYFKCFGKRDVEKGTPMTADTIFPIHSVTKTITSAAAMMLVDQGKIALDDPVSKYIPSFAGMKVGVERKDDTGRPVLDLTPKQPTPLLTRLVITVDPKDYVVRQAVLYDQFQNTVTMTFNKVQINPGLSDTLFVFTPPKDAAVVPLDPR